MALLPFFKSNEEAMNLLQTRWSAILSRLLANPSLNSLILKDISLISGSNVINHKLGRKLQGWKIVRQRASASIYDTQDSNQSPELTLLLTSDTDVSCDIEVF